MIIVAATAILILGIAYFQMKQGLFSALLLATWTVISAGLAVTCYESLAKATGLYEMQPAIAEGASLILLFLVPLMLLRFVGDRLIRGDILFSVPLDRIGGGFFGLIVGIFAVGTLMLVVQMAPLGRTILGFRPFADSLQREQRLMPFYPDEAVVGFAEILSGGSMSGSRKLETHHPDLLLEQFCGRNTAGRGGTVAAMDADFSLESVYKLTESDAKTIWDNLPASPAISSAEDTDVYVVRVKIAAQAADEDRWWRLPATQFRMLCVDETEATQNAYPLAYTFYRDGASQLARHPEEGPAEPAALIVVRPAKATKGKKKSQDEEAAEDTGLLTIDWIYRVPTDAKPKQIWFRRTVGANVENIIDGYAAGLRDEALHAAE